MAVPSQPTRTGAVLCPDWPVVAGLVDAGMPAAAPAAVLRARRVTATSISARHQGVAVGMRQRDAQALCPDLVLLPADEGRDARLFEPVITAVEDLVAGVQIIRPGLAVFAADGAARYAGSEELLSQQLVEHVTTETGLEIYLGIAEGIFAAAIAAGRPLIVPVGHTPAFLADVDVGVLGRPPLVSVLRRCGITTLGQLAALDKSAVVSRFGAEGVIAYQLAQGAQEVPIVARRPDLVLDARMEFDPPAERIQYATAAVHTAAERFWNQLRVQALVCTVLRIDAHTEGGDTYSRCWRADGVFTFDQIATRLRWQLEAWLTAHHRPTSGITELALVAEQVAPANAMQLGLWGNTGTERARAHLAADRVQAQLGIHSVTTAEVAGGRIPRDQATFTLWRDQETDAEDAALPWPDAVPAPIQTLPTPKPVALVDAGGRDISIDDRYLLSAPPFRLARQGSKQAAVRMWAGPWAMRERWWDTADHHHGAWLQLVVTTSPGVDSAVLLFHDTHRWWLVGSYD